MSNIYREYKRILQRNMLYKDKKIQKTYMEIKKKNPIPTGLK